MKAEYNSLIYAYESNNVDILNIIGSEFDIATEAESKTPDEINGAKAVSDTVKSDEAKAIDKTKLINKTIERVKALIKKIGEIFNSLQRKLLNRLRLLGETDKGFFTLYKKRKAMIKPYQTIKVISYQYNNQVLDQPIEKMLTEIVTCIDKMRATEGTVNSSARISDILNASQGNVIEVLLDPYLTGGSDIKPTNISEFVKYLVSKYRGDKKELVYRDSQIPQIEANALSTKELASKCNGYLKKAQEAYNKIKTLEYQVSRNSSDDKVVKLVTANAAKAATLYNAYSALLHAYYELKLEQSLNYRAILKKFYQF